MRACHRLSRGEVLISQKKTAPKGARSSFHVIRPESLGGLTEQGQNVLRTLVGDRQRLDAELLLCLQSLETGRFLVHVSVNQLTHTTVNCVTQSRHKVFLQVDAAFHGTQGGCSIGDIVESGIDAGDHGVQTSKVSIGDGGNIQIRNTVAGDVGQGCKTAVLVEDAGLVGSVVKFRCSGVERDGLDGDGTTSAGEGGHDVFVAAA